MFVMHENLILKKSLSQRLDIQDGVQDGRQF